MLSADGGTVIYYSASSNLVAGDTNGAQDGFLTRVNRSPNPGGFTTTVVEDVAVGTTVITSDLDADPLTFSITSGNSAGLFAMGANTGIVATARALDYETTTSHELTVTVTDFDPFHEDNGSVFAHDIEWLAQSGITAGCGPRLFCRQANVTRGQMAAFLTRALELPATIQDYFIDDDTSIFEDNINRLAAFGITKGCGPTAFCPEESVTRQQMAAFLVRGLGYTNNGGGDLFEDDDGSIFENDIDKLATAGVTLSCNRPENTNFCPTRNVTRGQMAAFLRRALDI